MPIDIKRTTTKLRPDQSRVLLRPFVPGDSERISRIMNRIMAIPEERVKPLLEEVLQQFSRRHDQMETLFQRRFEQLREWLVTDAKISHQRQLLIGSYFMAEYALESAALFNPSIVPHPDQTDLAPGALRFVLSLRATGEGHISSITFRGGIIHPDNRIEIEPAAELLTEPRQVPNALYGKASFSRKLFEVGLNNIFTRCVMAKLDDSFTLDELRVNLETESENCRASHNMTQENDESANGIMMLARSNYEVQFRPEQGLSQRIIFPATPSQRNGIEDARFVCFRNDDGSHVYYATFTAFDGKVIMPELIETNDFLHFRFITLNGPAAENKGMAIFPRKIDGCYAMLSRQDNENIYLMFSDSVHFWEERKLLLKPAFDWELVQLGNCGSPIETDAGWLVISHGVGPLRKYCIGAFLLDLDDPSKVIGRMREPLLKPEENEREGYVPNVVYTCGTLLHNGNLIIPYGLSDYGTGFATAPLDQILSAMN